MARTCLCMDVGGSSIKYAKLDEKRNLVNYGKVPTPHEGTEAYLSRLQEICRKFEGQVEGISMSVPGIIDSTRGICITAGNLRFADGLHLVEEMERRCKMPVAIMNDAKSAALAEAAWGALKDCKDGVVLVLGTGVGGALVKDGEVHMGSHFAAGEFSFAMLGEWVDQEAVGGGISRQPKLFESIRKNLDHFYAVYPVDAPPVDLAVCRFFNEANLMGAYRNYLRTFGEE